MDQLESSIFLKADSDKDGFSSVSLNKAKFLAWLTGEWTSVVAGINGFSSHVDKDMLPSLLDHWTHLLCIISSRYWPLHPNEMKDFQVERQRIVDAIALYGRMDSEISTRMIKSPEGLKRLRAVEENLFNVKRYDGNQQAKVKEGLQELDRLIQYTLNITEDEKKELVEAFGGTAGRWFKCANGHVYVITECGGAMMKGVCNECGVEIGGESHRLVEDNFLATEMDGAVLPLWPTMLDRDDPDADQ